MNPEQTETLAERIRQFLIFNGMWTEVEIYFNDSKLTTYEEETKNYYYNDPNHLICMKNATPNIEAAEKEYIWINCKGEFLDCINNNSRYGSTIDKSIQKDFQKILSQYHLQYKIQGNWLTCYAEKHLMYNEASQTSRQFCYSGKDYQDCPVTTTNKAVYKIDIKPICLYYIY